MIQDSGSVYSGFWFLETKNSIPGEDSGFCGGGGMSTPPTGAISGSAAAAAACFCSHRNVVSNILQISRLRASFSSLCVNAAILIIIPCHCRRIESHRRRALLKRCHRPRDSGVRPRSICLPRGLAAQRPCTACHVPECSHCCIANTYAIEPCRKSAECQVRVCL